MQASMLEGRLAAGDNYLLDNLMVKGDYKSNIRPSNLKLEKGSKDLAMIELGVCGRDALLCASIKAKPLKARLCCGI